MRDIVRSGIVGYKTKWEPRRHRSSRETEPAWRNKKLTRKTNWFMQRRDRDTGNEQIDRQASKKHRRHDKDKPSIEKSPSTVLFVERTGLQR